MKNPKCNMIDSLSAKYWQHLMFQAKQAKQRVIVIVAEDAWRGVNWTGGHEL